VRTRHCTGIRSPPWPSCSTPASGPSHDRRSATAAESAEETGNVRTPAELFADAAQLAATQRTATWLDELTLDGTLGLRERARIAAEDGAASLTRVLRSAEIAGQDAREVLAAAIADRPLDGARNATNVIYSRISDRHRFDPAGDTWAEWTPKVEDPGWQTYLDRLAVAADARTVELGKDAADELPRWALDAFGLPPAETVDRDNWIADVGSVAAYRDLRQHAGDADALGPAPAPGHVEVFAAYRAAWRTPGRPEIDREEAELSDGQLRVRILAADREAAWGPRYVGNELAGTHQAIDTHRQKAALLLAEVDRAGGAEDAERLRSEAREATALAAVLETRATQLGELDDVRARWLAHTAGTRARGDRCKAELALRHAGDIHPEPAVTAEEWLDAHRASDAEEDHFREITEEYEFADASIEDLPDLGQEDSAALPEQDIREEAAAEPPRTGEDAVRVPTPKEVTDSLNRAQRSLAEITAREVHDEERAAEERAAELNHWHVLDVQHVSGDVDEHTAEEV
jgi:hypothetical protein